LAAEVAEKVGKVDPEPTKHPTKNKDASRRTRTALPAVEASTPPWITAFHTPWAQIAGQMLLRGKRSAGTAMLTRLVAAASRGDSRMISRAATEATVTHHISA